MQKTKNVMIAGAGGIGQAVALLLTEFSDSPPNLFIGNRHIEKARQVAQWIKLGTSKSVVVNPFHLKIEKMTAGMREAFEQSDLILDCLPGRFAPRIACLAKEHGLHYANLTEYVTETEEIVRLAENSDTAFLLQTGLAPGFVNVLGHGLFQQFCAKHGVKRAGYLGMKVGALTRHATSPHFYGFTWSPEGVATEYIKESTVIRDRRKTTLPSLSEREPIIINGIPYEADLTSGGAANLPDVLAGKVERLDYKTIRYPGHYSWVDRQLEEVPADQERIEFLQEQMESRIPHVEDDLVLIYSSVEGKDRRGVWQKMDRTYHLRPQPIGRHTLRAVQAATAAPLAEAANMLLGNPRKGAIFQSQIDPDTFLNGRFVTAVYGKWNGGDGVLAAPQYKIK